jgi:helix-turn-helix protein
MNTVRERNENGKHWDADSQEVSEGFAPDGYDFTRTAFVPAHLDDCGLDPYAYRLYCHMVRRANGLTGECFESQANMAKATRMSPRKVRSSLRLLEGRRMVLGDNRQNQQKATVYTLTPAQDWVFPFGLGSGVVDTLRRHMPEGAAPHAGGSGTICLSEGSSSEGPSWKVNTVQYDVWSNEAVAF